MLILLASTFFLFVEQSAQDTSANYVVAPQTKIDTLEKKIAILDSLLARNAKAMEVQEKKVASHDTIIEELSTSLHREFGTPAIAGHGFTIGVNATMVLQGTNNPNEVVEASGTKDVGDVSFAAEVTFKKDFSTAHGKAFLRYEAGQGNGINQDLSVFCNANASAYPGKGIWVAEAWYEQKFLSDKVVGTIGYLFPAAYFDNNSVANDQTTQFLNAIFVNNPAFEMPVYVPGVTARYLPVDNCEISGAMFDADGDWQRIGDNLFNVGQLSYSPLLFGSSGTYRMFGWYNNLPHHSWDDPSNTWENSYGFGISIDQQITTAVTAFARYGWRSPETYDSQAVAVAQTYSTLIAQSWSVGAQVGGKSWHRENDVLGIGFGQAIPSAKYLKAMALANAEPESHLEIYYLVKCFEHMGISPDFQYVVNPFGKDLNSFAKGVNRNAAAIAVAGLRSLVDF
jgi:high affinity Mn2+ porin